MPLRSDWSERPCTIARGVDVLGDPWSLLILREAFGGATRFEEFSRHTGITDKALSGRLKTMTENGLLERVDAASGSRPRPEYRLTRAGADALPVLHAFALWAEQHAPNAELGRLGINCRACGARAQSADTCRTCGHTLDIENTRWTWAGSRDGEQVDLSNALHNLKDGRLASR
ncbi:winged helix-turn-helix transcriptional regulator [Curtobacterium sp. USHLN213]|uniref:winged helix-turn-helix transcriptional regulator n=1 Tax=Curtobacterium sp. USHLN213 TaxID=3081255 RepID=UPI00301B61FE